MSQTRCTWSEFAKAAAADLRILWLWSSFLVDESIRIELVQAQVDRNLIAPGFWHAWSRWRTDCRHAPRLVGRTSVLVLIRALVLSSKFEHQSSGMRTCGHVDMWTWGHGDMGTCGHGDMLKWGHVDIGYVKVEITLYFAFFYFFLKYFRFKTDTIEDSFV